MIENTTAANTLDKLLVALPGAGGIEAQEAQGQAQVVAQSGEWVQIPAEFFGCSPGDLIDMGFVIGDVVEGDPLWRLAKLPEGWAFRAADHSMWSYIDDENGKQRIALFYKAAFYDRRATLYIREGE
jgi:hypothetical protein